MAWVDDLLRLLSHPAVAAILPMLLRGGSRRESEVYDRLLALLQALPRGGEEASPRAAVREREERPPVLSEARDRIVRVAAALKEALRFAREDGLDHPEVQKRLEDVERVLGDLTDLERYTLAPERVRSLREAERRVVEDVLPAIRRLRQAGLNRLGTVEDLAAAAATAGELATKLRVAAALTERPQPYSRYAPEMSIDTGCVECGRAHLAAVEASLRRAAEIAGQRGFGDPEVQSRLAMAEEELAALFDYDWTAERIARTPPADRAVLEAFVPRARRLYERLRSVADAEALATVAAEAVAVREGFREALKERERRGAEHARTVAAG